MIYLKTKNTPQAKWFLAFLIFSALVATLFLSNTFDLFKANPSPEPNPHSEQKSTDSSKNNSLAHWIQTEIKKSDAKEKPQNTFNSSIIENSPQFKKESKAQPERIEESETDFLEAELLADLLSNAVAKDQIMNEEHDAYNTLIAEDDFLNQSIDANWATEEEYLYIKMFGEDTSLAEYALRSSECRSSACKVVIATSLENEKDNLTEAIANALLKEKGSYSMTIPTGNSSDLEFYISEQSQDPTEQSNE